MRLEKKLLMLFSRLRVKPEIWISENLDIEDSSGFRFIKKKHLTGMVVFGINHPLAGYDVSIDNHLLFLDTMNKIKRSGVV